jgi:hypothetical protein
MFRLRPSLRASAFYAITYLFWVSFAYWAAPSIVARDKENLSIQNFVAAALLAVLLHVMIVLFIWRIDHKHRNRFLEAVRPYSRANVTLIVFSAAFLALAVLSGIHGDYYDHLHEWSAVLGDAIPGKAKGSTPMGLCSTCWRHWPGPTLLQTSFCFRSLTSFSSSG